MKVKYYYACEHTVERNRDARRADESSDCREMKRHGVVETDADCPKCKKEKLTNTVNRLSKDQLRKIVLDNIYSRSIQWAIKTAKQELPK